MNVEKLANYFQMGVNTSIGLNINVDPLQKYRVSGYSDGIGFRPIPIT